MPSDEKIEKVARAIYEGTTPVLHESLGPRWTPVDFAIADANTRRVHHVMARAALAAMEREGVKNSAEPPDPTPLTPSTPDQR